MKRLYFADCLDVLKELAAERPQGFVDLIYIDPPFNSKRNYNILFEDVDMADVKAQREAFADTWSNVSYLDTLNELADLNYDLYEFLKTLDKINISKSAVSYLTTMAIRILYMRKVLKETGSFYLHCDSTMSHFLKLICDIIFGNKIIGFKNEIIWNRTKAHSDSRNYANVNDSILFFTKSSKFVFNTQYQPYTDFYIEKYYNHREGNRRFHDRNLSAKGLSGGGYEYEWNGVTTLWRCPKKTMEKLHKENKLYYTKNGTARYKQYLDEMKGVPATNNWSDIPPINSQAKERLGYPTQKPIALLERIIKASSNEGDLVADFFCGCGTSIAAAEKLGRQWIGVDISHLAIKLIIDRLTKPIAEEGRKKYLKNIDIRGFPRDIAGAKQLARKSELQKQKNFKGGFDFQKWIVEFMLGGVENPKKIADGGWDGYLTFYKNNKEKGRVLIEVKSGNVNVKNVREFVNVINKQVADIGVFVCFADQVTDPMIREAKSAGNFPGYKVDKIQILTVEDIFDDRTIKLPGGTTSSVFITATQDVRPIKKDPEMF